MSDNIFTLGTQSIKHYLTKLFMRDTTSDNLSTLVTQSIKDYSISQDGVTVYQVDNSNNINGTVTNYKAQNSYRYGTVEIKAADMNILELHQNSIVTNRIKIKETADAITNYLTTHELKIDDKTKSSLYKQKFDKIVMKDGTHYLSPDAYYINGSVEELLVSVGSKTYSLRAPSAVTLQAILDNTLNSDHAKEVFNEIFAAVPELNNNPISSINDKKHITSEDAFLSITYSNNHDKTKAIISKLLNSNNLSHNIIKDVISTVALGVAKGANYLVTPSDFLYPLPTKLVEDIKNIAEIDISSSHLTTILSEPLKILITDKIIYQREDRVNNAAYSSQYNVANSPANERYIIHELTHATLNHIFKNNMSPYSKGSEHSFENVKKEFIYNLNTKLQNTNNLSLDDSFEDMISDIKSTYILKLLSVLKATDADLASIKYQKDTIFGPEFTEAIITKKTVEKMLKYETERLQLNDCDLTTIDTFRNLLFSYNINEFDAELPAHIAESLYETSGKCDIGDLIKPFTQYWENVVSPIIKDQLVIPHEIECSGTNIDKPTFEHCVEGYY